MALLSIVVGLSACGAPDELRISISNGSGSSGNNLAVLQPMITGATPGATQAAAGNGSANAKSVVAAITGLRSISQRDRTQYDSPDQYIGNAGSSCSATAAAMVLTGYGKNVRIADVLKLMQANGALRNTGLSAETFGVLRDTVPTAFGLKGSANANANIDGHLGDIKSWLAQNRAVMADVYDPTFFPGGHWIVLTGFAPQSGLPATDHGLAIDATSAAWQEGGLYVLNPDPDTRNGRVVEQLWPVSGFKSYFRDTHLSLVYSPK